MKNHTIISVRSNCDFSLDYESHKLHPKAEIVILTTEPIYKLNTKKTGIEKGQEVKEFRFVTGLDGVNELIGQLQNLSTQINHFEQMGTALNGLIKSFETNTKK